ncbi:unnamed protein product, partial [Mesorhabditis belari]|uniref:Sigma non-opioid intracellular receptor 1 n=1 Tax=Mesorhabditis belari TaxID=2138241 RepID=A0AAF3EWJ0_9BILA
MGFFFSKVIRYLVLLYIVYSGAQYWLRWKSYGFSPKEFRTIAAKALGPSGDEVLARELARKYGNAIVPDSKWASVRAGGLNLRIKLLHVSLTEYVAVISSSFPTTGRSGFHWSNSTCTVLSGALGRHEDLGGNMKEQFKAGDNFRQGQFDSFVYSFGEDTAIACYGRGVVPVSALWTTVGSITTGDPALVGRQLLSFGEVYFHSFVQSASNLFDYYQKKAKSEL